MKLVTFFSLRVAIQTLHFKHCAIIRFMLEITWTQFKNMHKNTSHYSATCTVEVMFFENSGEALWTLGPRNYIAPFNPHYMHDVATTHQQSICSWPYCFWYKLGRTKASIITELSLLISPGMLYPPEGPGQVLRESRDF